MAQNRPPPAYQEYAASMLANIAFRKMSLDARGLLYTLRLEYWLETPLPADVLELSQLLRMDSHAVKAGLAQLEPLIIRRDGFLHIPELQNYRQHLDERKQKQSEGGKKGAVRAIANRNRSNRGHFEQVRAEPEATHGSTLGSSVQCNSDQYRSDQLNSVINADHQEWIQDYDRAS